MALDKVYLHDIPVDSFIKYFNATNTSDNENSIVYDTMACMSYGIKLDIIQYTINLELYTAEKTDMTNEDAVKTAPITASLAYNRNNLDVILKILLAEVNNNSIVLNNTSDDEINITNDNKVVFVLKKSGEYYYPLKKEISSIRNLLLISSSDNNSATVYDITISEDKSTLKTTYKKFIETFKSTKINKTVYFTEKVDTLGITDEDILHPQKIENGKLVYLDKFGNKTYKDYYKPHIEDHARTIRRCIYGRDINKDMVYMCAKNTPALIKEGDEYSIRYWTQNKKTITHSELSETDNNTFYPYKLFITKESTETSKEESEESTDAITNETEKSVQEIYHLYTSNIPTVYGVINSGATSGNIMSLNNLDGYSGLLNLKTIKINDDQTDDNRIDYSKTYNNRYSSYISSSLSSTTMSDKREGTINIEGLTTMAEPLFMISLSFLDVFKAKKNRYLVNVDFSIFGQTYKIVITFKKNLIISTPEYTIFKTKINNDGEIISLEETSDISVVGHLTALLPLLIIELKNVKISDSIKLLGKCSLKNAKSNIYTIETLDNITIEAPSSETIEEKDYRSYADDSKFFRETVNETPSLESSLTVNFGSIIFSEIIDKFRANNAYIFEQYGIDRGKVVVHSYTLDERKEKIKEIIKSNLINNTRYFNSASFVSSNSNLKDMNEYCKAALDIVEKDKIINGLTPAVIIPDDIDNLFYRIILELNDKTVVDSVNDIKKIEVSHITVPEISVYNRLINYDKYPVSKMYYTTEYEKKARELIASIFNGSENTEYVFANGMSFYVSKNGEIKSKREMDYAIKEENDTSVITYTGVYDKSTKKADIDELKEKIIKNTARMIDMAKTVDIDIAQKFFEGLTISHINTKIQRAYNSSTSSTTEAKEKKIYEIGQYNNIISDLINDLNSTKVNNKDKIWKVMYGE